MLALRGLSQRCVLHGAGIPRHMTAPAQPRNPAWKDFLFFLLSSKWSIMRQGQEDVHAAFSVWDGAAQGPLRCYAVHAVQGSVAEVPCILRAPAARGLVAVGLTSGGVALIDPRASMAAQHSIAAHSAGLADVDVRGDMLATCGYGTRQGQIISDSYVKVG